MKANNLTSYRFILAVTALVSLVALAACGDYKVPITERSTRKIDSKLVGNWVSPDGAERFKVRPLDDSTYVISYASILLRAFHSDIDGVPFINVQDVETPERSYIYMTYRLSDDGKQLYVRLVNDELVPAATRDSTNVQKLLKNNLENPLLFGREAQFRREQ